jgi:hypothetical protein
VPHPRPTVLVAVFAVLALAAVACEKVNDVPRLQDEALEVAKGYQLRFGDLTRRADAIALDRVTGTDARWAYAQARSTLDRVRNELQQAPITIQDKAKSGRPEDLEKLIDTMRDRFEAAVTDATSKLTAVESWLALAERPGGLASPPSTGEPDRAGAAPVR